MIRELKEQNDKLRAQLSGGKIDMSEVNEIARKENLTDAGELKMKKKKKKGDEKVFNTNGAERHLDGSK